MTQLVPRVDLAIVGAGAVGLATALWAQKAGLSVAIVERGAPGGSASFGNAGTIATYACIPVNSPALYSQFPSILFSDTSPIRVDLLHALYYFPWFAKFLCNSTHDRVEEISKQLAVILAQADAGLDPLLSLVQADDLIVNNGCLYVYATVDQFNQAIADINLRQKLGIQFNVIDEASTKSLEPNIKMPVHKALFFKNARHVCDPGELMRRLSDRFVSDGGHWVSGEARSCSVNQNGAILKIWDDHDVECDHLVIAAGAHSREVSGSGAERLPLNAERGYHLMFRHAAKLLSRPVGWAHAGLYATPMTSGLRIAGTVELAGLSPKINHRRLDYLKMMSERMLGPLGVPCSSWLGFRPSMPDALPVIGRSEFSERIFYAFGHQHIGLTLSGITGKIISDLLLKKRLDFDIRPFSPSRF